MGKKVLLTEWKIDLADKIENIFYDILAGNVELRKGIKLMRRLVRG